MESRQFRLRKIRTQILLFVPLGLMVISLCLIWFGTFQSHFLGQFKMALQETVAPIVRFVSAPIRWTKHAYHATTSFMDTYSENEMLRAENEQLRGWRNIALQLSAEQEDLKRIMAYVPPQKSKSVVAKVLTDTGSRFSKSLIVSAGRHQGVSKGDIAMTSAGVYGRIVEVGKNASRLMLLTDYASRVPVAVGSEKVTCILAGDGSNTPKLVSLPEDSAIRPGDIVLTSGQVGVYPSGLGIGVVESIDSGDIKVRLFEESISPDFVRLVNFGLETVLLPSDCPIEEE